MKARLRDFLTKVLSLFAPMAITRGNRSRTLITASTTSGDVSHTVAADTTLLLLYIGVEGGESISGTPQWVPDVGEDFTLIQSIGASTNSGDCKGYWYGLVNPTPGAGTIDVVFTTAVNPGVCVAIDYLGTVSSTVAAATNALSTDVNDSATSTTVLPSGGSADNTHVVGAHFQGDDGIGITYPTITGGFNMHWFFATGTSSSQDFSVAISELIGASGASAPTITWEVSDENVGGMIELLPDNTVTAAGTSTSTGTLTALGTRLDRPEQEGYRWRNDNGSQTTATWRQIQDTPDSIAQTENIRLRMLTDHDGNPDTAQITLQYKRIDEPPSEWRDV